LNDRIKSTLARALVLRCNIIIIIIIIIIITIINESS